MSIRISYAQNREDIILDAFFDDVKEGFYIDVGANHPENDSVTKIFYDKGWSGVNLEPNRELYRQLLSERPRDINLNIGVSDKPGKLNFREYANHGLSTFSGTMHQEYEGDKDQLPNSSTGEFSEYEVEVQTLKEICHIHKIKHIHFLKIDVEGLEYEVLAGNDWEKNRPEVICIEANHIIKDWRPIIKSNGYTNVFFDGLNEYYVANENKQRLENFSYPNKIILGPPVIHISSYNEIRRRDEQNENLKNQYLHAKAETRRLSQHIEHIHEELNRKREFKNQLKEIFRSVDGHINRRIDNLRDNTNRSYDELLNDIKLGQGAPELMVGTRLADFKVFYNRTRSRQLLYKNTKFIYGKVRKIAKISIKTIKNIKTKGRL